MIKIIIADDHPIFIDGLKTVLESAPEICIVGEALNGIQLLELLKIKKADIVLLDINMPKMDGLEAARNIKRQYGNVKIIILTQYSEKGFIKKCMEMGVEGYLLKGCEKQELVRTITTVNDKGIHYDVNNNLNQELFAPKNNHKDFHITEKETQVLKLIANEKSNPEIAKKLNISINTVKTYRERLMIKTGTKNTAGLICWAMKNKLL